MVQTAVLFGEVGQAGALTRSRQQPNPSDSFDAGTRGILAALDSTPIVERLGLATPVMLRNGVTAVVSAHSTCDAQRYRLSWFDRRMWTVRHKWYDRGCFEVIASTQNQTALA